MNTAGLFIALPLLLTTVAGQSAGTVYDLPGPTVPIVEVSGSSQILIFLLPRRFGRISRVESQVTAAEVTAAERLAAGS